MCTSGFCVQVGFEAVKSQASGEANTHTHTHMDAHTQICGSCLWLLVLCENRRTTFCHWKAHKDHPLVTILSPLFWKKSCLPFLPPRPHGMSMSYTKKLNQRSTTTPPSKYFDFARPNIPTPRCRKVQYSPPPVLPWPSPPIYILDPLAPLVAFHLISSLYLSFSLKYFVERGGGGSSILISVWSYCLIYWSFPLCFILSP